jgi:hypothetical protein
MSMATENLPWCHYPLGGVAAEKVLTQHGGRLKMDQLDLDEDG